MIAEHKGRYFQIDPISIGLHVIAFVGIVASIHDGLVPVGIALLILIYDMLRNPEPNIYEVEIKKEESDDKHDGDVLPQ